MNIIFLDIDGVLTSFKYMIEKYKEMGRSLSSVELINPSRLLILKKIVDATDAKIVLISSFRINKDLEEYQKFLKLLEDYNLFIYDLTPSLGNRGEEIRFWLNNHKEVNKFVIIDDDVFSDYNELINYQIKPSYYIEYGLSEEDAFKAIKMLK